MKLLCDQRFENLCYDVIVHDPHSNEFFLALHGMSESKNSFRATIGPEDGADVRVPPRNLLRLDRPGYGLSSYPVGVTPDEYDYLAFSRNVKRLINHLKIEIVGVVGFSSGGPYALHLCAHLRTISRCILLGSDVEYASLTLEEREKYDPFHSPTVFEEFLAGLNANAPSGLEQYSRQADGKALGLHTERELSLDREGRFDDNLRLSIRRNVASDVVAAIRVDHRLERTPWDLRSRVDDVVGVGNNERDGSSCLLRVVIAGDDPFFDAEFFAKFFSERLDETRWRTEYGFSPVKCEIVSGYGHFDLLYDYWKFTE